MRLIDIEVALCQNDPSGQPSIDAGKLKLKYFDHENPVTRPPYAILSHTWSQDNTQEVTHADFANHALRSTKPSFAKILQCCRLALAQGLKYVWVDTCCIDKSSSAELQEAINTMYTWYRQSQVCYVFLTDRNGGVLGGCNWFRRGWTLQELLAPGVVEFYDLVDGVTSAVNPGNYTREGLARQISQITGIGERYLDGTMSTDRASVAERMSWVSMRKTKKDEDMAYCMLGLFDVSLPLLYGEGWGAFRRLQEAIIAKSDDESIFAWQAVDDEPRGMIASLPLEFQNSGKIRGTNFHRTRPPYAVTNRGVEFWKPARSVPGLVTRWMRQSTFNGLWGQVTRPFLLRLNCEDEEGRLVAIKLAPDPATGTLYRMNSASLERCEKEGHLDRMAVLYGGYEQIYVKEPDRPVSVQAEPPPPATLLDRIVAPFRILKSTFSFDNLLLILVIQSFTVFFLLATTLHRTLRLEPLSKLNVFLGWAYLTLGWKVLGENFYFWFGALACGAVTSRGVGMVQREMAGALLAPGLLGVAGWGVAKLTGRGGGG